MENAKPVEKGRLRKFSIMSVGVGQKEIDEFSVAAISRSMTGIPE